MNSNFDRVTFKERAKDVLRSAGYWMPVLVCFVASLFGAVGGSGSGGSGSFSSSGSTGSDYSNLSTEELIAIILVVTIIMFIVLGISLCFSFFVTQPMVVGLKNYFMNHRLNNGTSKFTDLFSSFRRGRYMATVKTMFMYQLKIFLWSLLLIIPGIIKSYQYYFVPYIMSENPEIGIKRAFEISKYMTDGHKFDIFVVELSFIGWRILGVLCCCIGGYFLEPYVQATYAEMYEERREYALATGFVTDSELCGF